MSKYLKFSSTTLLCLWAVFSFSAGGPWMWLPLALVVLVAVTGDAFLPADDAQDHFAQSWILNGFLFANLPLLLLITALLLLRVDLWVHGVESASGLATLLLPKERLGTTSLDVLGGFLGMGLLYGIAATTVAHELVHRTWSPWALSTGRWLLAFTWDGEFAIEHVYGHHRKVATVEDPASARRGETFYAFFLRSLISSHRSAWQIEAGFLAKKGLRPWSFQNRLLKGWSMSLGLALGASLLAGWAGLAAHLLLALYGKGYLELVNYIEHYGLVRSPRSPVQARHSWNSNAPISSWFLYNLPRHSHHHAVGHLPFWRLNPEPEAPRLPFGYMTMILIALVPPAFHRLMKPHLANWDSNYASLEERDLAAPVSESAPLS